MRILFQRSVKIIANEDVAFLIVHSDALLELR